RKSSEYARWQFAMRRLVRYRCCSASQSFGPCVQQGRAAAVCRYLRPLVAVPIVPAKEALLDRGERAVDRDTDNPGDRRRREDGVHLTAVARREKDEGSDAAAGGGQKFGADDDDEAHRCGDAKAREDKGRGA